MITIAEIERAYDAPVNEWPGKCHGVAIAAAKLIDGAEVVYGHYLGSVAPGTLFETGSRAGFCRHGWVLLPDGRVLDPTRWVFEGREPYLYVGSADDYDEGGNAHRIKMHGKPPQFDASDEVLSISKSMLPTAAFVWLEELLSLQDHFADDHYEPGDVTRAQLFWLANLDPRCMGDDGCHAEAVYRMLALCDCQVFIPIDNQDMVKHGRHRKGAQR